MTPRLALAGMLVVAAALVGCGDDGQGARWNPVIGEDGSAGSAGSGVDAGKDTTAAETSPGDAKVDTTSSDAAAEDGSPPVDPCTGANLGDGIYCGASLQGGLGEPDTLYECAASKTVKATPCQFGCFVAPAGTADHCKSDPSSTPTGKGVWVWMFNTTSPSPATVAKEAADLGVGFVLIKSGENDSFFDSNFNETIVQEFTSRGIRVYGWPWIDPGNTATRVKLAAQAANVPGVEGIVLDVESKWESSSGAYKDDAIALCDGIRAAAPGKFLGFSSFGWISYHTIFPFKEFDQHCGDAHLPQTYYVFWSITPTQAYQQAVQQAGDLGLTAPIWAVQQNYGEGNPDATVAEMNEFFDAAGPNSSLFRWPNPGDTSIRNAMNSLHWKN